MEKYLGVKLIQAERMNLIDFKLKIQGEHSEDNQEGYLVVYQDGYKSWSPKAVFEEAYRRIDNLTFGLAIEALKMGYRVTRKGWNGKGMWLLLQKPDANSKMTLPYIYIEYPVAHPAYPNGSRVPWLASQTDVLAEDWVIIE